MPVARKTLLEEPLRFALAVAGVALSIVLILVLIGIYDGIQAQVAAYLDNAPADLVVAQKGQRNLLGARSTLPTDAVSAVRGVEGVETALPVVVQYVVLELHGRKEFTLMIGFDPGEGAGPWRMSRGTADLQSGQVVLDQALARLRGLDVGDEMEILGEKFEIAGLSQGSSTFMTGTVFLTREDAARLVSARGPSFVLVKLANGADPDEVASRVEAAVPSTVSTRERVRRNDIALFASILRGPVGFMVVVAFLVGVLLVGLTTYTATVERAKDYGALKAIGVPNGKLYRIVLQQALISSVAGSVLGVALSFVVARGIEFANPRFLIPIEPIPTAVVVATALAMGALGALAPVAALAQIDPAIAFRRAV